jgi:hypothetical protein
MAEPLRGHAALKRRLSGCHEHDREAYTEGRAPFIVEALESRGT